MMGRRAKTADEVFYDIFADMPVNEQAIALRIMQEIHRQKQKQERRSNGTGGTQDEPSDNNTE